MTIVLISKENDGKGVTIFRDFPSFGDSASSAWTTKLGCST
jgi:hypothetical protein